MRSFKRTNIVASEFHVKQLIPAEHPTSELLFIRLAQIQTSFTLHPHHCSDLQILTHPQYNKASFKTKTKLDTKRGRNKKETKEKKKEEEEEILHI
jgi:hypothetical protein